MTAPDLVLVGAVLGAFGVRGEIRVRTFTQTPKAIAAYGPLLDEAGRVLLTPRRTRPIKDGLALACLEVTDRDAAEALKGRPLYVPRAKLPAPEEEEYYYVDLVGCRVETLEGERLGEVIGVQDFGAGALLDVRGDRGPGFLHPFTLKDAPIVDLTHKRIVILPLASDE